jgi:hypothetical protein
MNFRFISIGDRDAIVVLSQAPSADQTVHYVGVHGTFPVEIELLSNQQHVLGSPIGTCIARIHSHHCQISPDGKVIYRNPDIPTPAYKPPTTSALRHNVFDVGEDFTIVELLDLPPQGSDRLHVQSGGFTGFIGWEKVQGKRYKLDRALRGEFNLRIYHAQQEAIA